MVLIAIYVCLCLYYHDSLYNIYIYIGNTSYYVVSKISESLLASLLMDNMYNVCGISVETYDNICFTIVY